MAEQKTNRRVQYTRSALREALIGLISEKPLANITVTDICARADINRSTFYLHYQGVHELLGEIEEQILSRIEEQLTQTPSLQTLNALVCFLKHIKQPPREVKLFYALGGDQGDPHFIRRLQQLIYDSFRRGWQNRMPEAGESQKRLVFSYIVPGTISVLSAWIHGDIPDLTAEEVVALLEAVIENGVNGISAMIGGRELEPPCGPSE